MVRFYGVGQYLYNFWTITTVSYDTMYSMVQKAGNWRFVLLKGHFGSYLRKSCLHSSSLGLKSIVQEENIQKSWSEKAKKCGRLF